MLLVTKKFVSGLIIASKNIIKLFGTPNNGEKVFKLETYMGQKIQLGEYQQQVKFILILDIHYHPESFEYKGYLISKTVYQDFLQGEEEIQ